MYFLKSKLNSFLENKNLVNFCNFKENFIELIFVYSFLILNLYIILILLPPYSHVEYGTDIYNFTTTNMHLFDDKFFYFLNFVILPFATIWILNSQFKDNVIFISICSLNIFFLFIILNGLTLIYNFYFNNQKNSIGNYNLFYVFLILEFILIKFLNSNFKERVIFSFKNNKFKFFFFYSIFFLSSCLFYKPFTFPEINEIDFLNDLNLFLNFNNIKTIFIVTLLSLFILIKFENNLKQFNHYKNFSYFLLIIFLILHLFFFETSFEINHHHYAPIMGPALHILNGSGFAGVDVHSQYGYLFFIILRFLFDFLPNTFGTTGLMIRVVNLLTILVVILIFFKLSKNKLLALLFASIFISIHLKFAAANFGSFPSLFGFRNLIPLISLFFLIKANNHKLINPLVLLIISLSSITSFEVFLYTFLPYISYSILLKTSLREFNDLKKIIFYSLGSVFLFHFIINIFYIIFTNNIINYSIYFEILKGMTISRWWPVPSLNLFFLPALYFLFYGITLIYCYQMLIKIWNNENKNQNLEDFNLFFSITSLGILMMIYYVSRSLPSNLQVASIPFYFLIYLYFEKFILKKNIEKKFLSILYSIIIYFVFSFSVFIGSPVDANRNGNMLIKKCFFNIGDCTLKNHLKKLVNTNHKFSPESEEYRIIQSANLIFEKFYKNKSEVLFFAYDGLSALPEIIFSENNKWYFHPISYVFSDELSKKKKISIFNKSNDLKDGQLITILKSRNIHRLEVELIDKITKEWYLCKTNYKDKYFKIFKLSKNEC